MEKFTNWHPNFPTSLTNCQDEPIHIPGAIQEFGLLIAFEPETQVVRAYSCNAVEKVPLLKQLNQKPIHLSEIVTFDPGFQFQFQIADKSFGLRKFTTVKIQSTDGIQSYPAVVYPSNNFLILEVEFINLVVKDREDLLLSFPRAIHDLQNCNTISDISNYVVKKIKELTHFDRVMMYQYDEDWNGEVIAEAKELQLEPFLGLHYPASDIPEQARKLYEKNWIRIIPTIHYKPQVLEPRELQGLDLSHSVLRSVSPIHIRYLQNMGVGASMSISILVDGKLWGLIACHHYAEHYIPLEVRLACETLAQVISWHIQSKQLSENLRKTSEDERSLNHVLESFSLNSDFRLAAKTVSENLLDMFGCTGMAIHLGEESVHLGYVPNKATVDSLIEHIKERSILEPYVTQSLSESNQSNFDKLACGCVALPLAPKKNYFMICFRPEQTHTISWAGNPKEKIDPQDADQRLQPRGSFALWKEENEGKSLPWSKRTIELMERFALLFIKVVIERKELVEKSNTELRSLSQAKDEFVAVVSHELRTPLNSIIGWTELLLSGQLQGEKLSDALKIIQRNARSQNQLISDLLDVSRIISGKLRLSVKNLRVSEIVEAVILSFEPAARAKNLKIVSALEGNTDSIIGDTTRIQQVVWNLLSNALKFSPKESRILVTVKRIHSQIQLEVTDQGPGIEPGHLKRIFGRFEQVDSSITRKSGGLGLGLSICKHIVELHGGTISAQSEGIGKGATFTVLFPIAPVVSEHSSFESPIDDRLGEISYGSEVAGRLKGEVILVVEDDQDAREFLTAIITANGAEVITAKNGKVALDILNDKIEIINIVLSDVGMPEMDGYTMVENIRNHPNKRIASVCTIALTAFGHPQDRIIALKKGFDSYIAKPVMQEELLTVLESSCKSNRRGR